MENTMSKEASALLRELFLSGIDAVGFHCRSPEPDEPEPEEPEPGEPTPDEPERD
jgi:hypothetical protein